MALLRGEKAQDQFLPVSLCVRESADASLIIANTFILLLT